MKDGTYEALVDLAAMRLLHAMPTEEALEKFSEIYGAIDKETLLERRRRAIAKFKEMFDTDEEPRNGPMYESLA